MVIKNLFEHSPVARYNMAAWMDETTGNVVMIAREVPRAAGKGRPDIGKLVLFEMDEAGEMVHERTVWEPVTGGIFLEDPRALKREDGSIRIGLTAVLNIRNEYIPYPAITMLRKQPWREELPAITLIESFGPGKNITPIRDKTFLFRPQGQEYAHKLLVFNFHDLLARKIQDLEFPTDLPWASWKVGTAMPPIWLSEDVGMLIFHGISVANGKFVYSLGRARLYRENGIFKVQVAPRPILTPDNFRSDKGTRLVKELHPRLRRVVYACGGVIKKSTPHKLDLYVNVGDTTTFDVQFDCEELKEGLF